MNINLFSFLSLAWKLHFFVGIDVDSIIPVLVNHITTAIIILTDYLKAFWQYKIIIIIIIFLSWGH